MHAMPPDAPPATTPPRSTWVVALGSIVGFCVVSCVATAGAAFFGGLGSGARTAILLFSVLEIGAAVALILSIRGPAEGDFRLGFIGGGAVGLLLSATCWGLGMGLAGG